MSTKSNEIIKEKEIRKKFITNKKNQNKLIIPRNKTIFKNNKRYITQVNVRLEDFIEKISNNIKNKNNQFSNNNKNVDNKRIQSEKCQKMENNINKNNLQNNERDKFFIEENNFYEKPLNAIEIDDLIGEKCPLDLDILNINFVNFEVSKISSKKIGQIQAYGVNTYQGLIRNYNEDKVSILINLAKPNNYLKKYWPKISFFGIYDGHGGSKCSEFLKDSLHKIIINDINFPENIELAIKNGFKNAEQIFLNTIALDQNDNNIILDRSGSCALIILFVDEIIYVANVGDSRALFSQNNGSNFIQITQDHKPNNPMEKKRIFHNGGQVYKSQTLISGIEKENILNGKILLGPYRVLPGRLSVSRTIGDIEAKFEKFGGNPNVIISQPDIFIYDLKKEKIDFFIMGCDGIFDQLSNEEIMENAWMIVNNNKKNIFVDYNNLKNENIEYNFQDLNIHDKCGIIVDFIIKASMVRRSFDNVTCLMIVLDYFNNKADKVSINMTKKENNDFNNYINIRPKKFLKIIKKRNNEPLKTREVKTLENQNINHNTVINNFNKNLKQNKHIENIKIDNYMYLKDNKIKNENKSKTYRNTEIKIKNNKKNHNINLISNNKISFKKINERLQNKKSNKSETIMNEGNNSGNNIIKKILKINKNKIYKDQLNHSQRQNGLIKNCISPIRSINNSINYNSNYIIGKIKNNKINKLPFQLNKMNFTNSKTNTNKNNMNMIHFQFKSNNPHQNNFKKLNIKTNSIGKIQGLNRNINRTITSPGDKKHLYFHIKLKKLNNMLKQKSSRNNNGFKSYREINKNNILSGNKINYSYNTHNVSDINSSNNYFHIQNFSNNSDLKSYDKGIISSRKKKFYYRQIVKKLSMNVDNKSQKKFIIISNKKISYSKEKDIQSFISKNKTNIIISPNKSSDLNKKISCFRCNKLKVKNGKKKINY